MYILLVYICLLWTFHMGWKWLLSIFHSNALIMELKKEEWLCLLKNLSRKIINERLEDWWMWKFDLNCQENSSLWFLLFRPLSWCKLITGPLVISKIKIGLWVYNIDPILLFVSLESVCLRRLRKFPLRKRFAWSQTQKGTALKYQELGAFVVQFSSLISGLITIEFTFLPYGMVGSMNMLWD